MNAFTQASIVDTGASDSARSRMGDRLVDKGLISPDQLDVALLEQKRSGKMLGEVMVDLGFITENTLAATLAESSGMDRFQLRHSVLDAATDVDVTPANWRALRGARDASETYCPDEGVTQRQCAIIRQAKVDRDTVGGVVESHVFGCPPGIGSCMVPP